jgi:uncharacterized protein
MTTEVDMKNEDLVTIVTGASAGIGAEASRLFCERGDHVVLAARRRERLEALAADLRASGGRCEVLPIDLSQPDAPVQLVQATLERFGRVDVLVNNAGYGQQTLFEEMPWEEVTRMFQVNVLSLMALSRAVIPIMRRQGFGRIVNVASVGGLVPHPLNATYCATKHAVVGFSRSLRIELKGSGVRVATVCPAGTRTEFFEVAERGLAFPSFFEPLAVPARHVAKAIVRATTRDRSIDLPSLGAKLQAETERLLPMVSERLNLMYRDLVLGQTQRAGE